jgi:hypothetical protein
MCESSVNSLLKKSTLQLILGGAAFGWRSASALRLAVSMQERL